MGWRTPRTGVGTALVVLLLLAGAAACGSDGRDASPPPVVPAGPDGTTRSTRSSTSTTSTTARPTTTTTAPLPPADRPTADGHGLPLAQAAEVVLVHPSARVERVGFHQSSITGARDLEPLPTAVSATTLSTRNRGTGDRTAVDVVVQPGTPVLAPVNGTVVAAGTYRLYCSMDDENVVIEPEAHPGWRVVLVHVEGARVAPGQVVEAGLTVVAAQARQLPFRSQVDRLATTQPPWPHVHVEVDDPTVADAPSKGDSCPAA